MEDEKKICKDKFGLPYYPTLPATFRLAVKADFQNPPYGKPYLVYSYVEKTYQAFRVRSSFPMQGFWQMIEDGRVYVRKLQVSK